MAQDRPVTPEKQLLKLIEVHKSDGRKIESRAIRRHGLSYLSVGAWRGRVVYFRDRFRQLLDSGNLFHFDVVALNRALYATISILIIYSATNLVYSVINLKTMPNLKIGMKKSDRSISALKNLSALKAPDYYLDRVHRKDIFKFGARAIAVQQEGKAPARVTTSRIIDATQHLKLVGISWSYDPDAIVEDTKAMRTFFVKKGHALGEVKVEAILKDRIVLSYGGEQIELK